LREGGISEPYSRAKLRLFCVGDQVYSVIFAKVEDPLEILRRRSREVSLVRQRVGFFNAQVECERKPTKAFTENLRQQEQLERKPSKVLKDPIIFKPGDIGIDADWESGIVISVVPGGQAERLGVKKGWEFHTLREGGISEPYSRAKLRLFCGGDQVYSVIFTAEARAARKLPTWPPKKNKSPSQLQQVTTTLNYADKEKEEAERAAVEAPAVQAAEAEAQLHVDKLDKDGAARPRAVSEASTKEPPSDDSLSVSSISSSETFEFAGPVDDDDDRSKSSLNISHNPQVVEQPKSRGLFAMLRAKVSVHRSRRLASNISNHSHEVKAELQERRLTRYCTYDFNSDFAQ